MHFFTSKKPIVMPDISLNGISIPVVDKAKLLGVTISSDLSWQNHVNEVVAKGSRALYMLHVMKKFQPPQEHMIKVYITYIRPLLEYCAPVFNAGLTAQQAQRIERIQKRALKIIGGYDQNYQQLLSQLNLESLADRRERLCLRFNKQMLHSQVHRDIFPRLRGLISGRNTRRQNTLETFCCGARLRKSSNPYITSLINMDIITSQVK